MSSSPAPDQPRRRGLVERVADRFHVSPREIVIALLPSIVLLVVVGYVAQRFVRPAPPSTIVMTVGSPGGAYDTFAKRYQAILARSGITLELHPSSGAVENYDRLRADRGVGGVIYDLGFVQSGIGSEEDAPFLETIAGVYYEPLWIFGANYDRITKLSDLQGKRVGIGVPGSGLRRLALQVLAAAGVDATNATLVELPGPESIEALRNGSLDVAFIVGAPDSPFMQGLFKSPLHIVSMVQSEAVARYFPTLTPLVLPQGAVDLAESRPSRDVKMVAATSLLVARDDLHPALVTLLLEAAAAVHGGPGLFQRHGEFPTSNAQDFPVSEQAARWFKSGPPFLQRYLPFWLANLIERLLVIFVPVVALAIPLMKVIPALYSWRVRSKIFRWYGQVKAIETDVRTKADRGELDEETRRNELVRLDEIEGSVNALKIPLSFYHEVHLVRAHVDLVRRHLSPTA